jgi:hypothetical protein
VSANGTRSSFEETRGTETGALVRRETPEKKSSFTEMKMTDGLDMMWSSTTQSPGEVTMEDGQQKKLIGTRSLSDVPNRLWIPADTMITH